MPVEAQPEAAVVDANGAPGYLSIRDLRKEFDGFVAVDDVNLDVRKGEIFALLGGSGSGKSTLLRCLGGFETPTKGSITLDGQRLDALPPYQRPVNMMFQSYALFPHMTVEQNIAFGLKQDGLDKAAIARRVGEMLELVSIIESSGVTCVMVTHDQEEAMTMATRIAVMDAGWIQQVGKPDEVYEQPANRFVAGFIGSVNLFEGVIDEDLPEYVTVRSPLFPAPVYIAHGITCYEGQPVAFALRPEKVMIGKDEPESPTNKAEGVIEDIAYFGSHSVYHVRLPSGAKVLANFANSQRWASDGLTWGDQVWVHWRDNDGVVLTS